MNGEQLDPKKHDSPWLQDDLFADVAFGGDESDESDESDKSNKSEAAKKQLENLPTTSKDRITAFYLRFIERNGRMEKVRNFLSEKLSTNPKKYQSIEEFDEDNPDYYEELDKSIPYDQQTTVRRYTGFTFSRNNSVARGIWEYEKLGARTPELEASIKKENDVMAETIDKAPAPQKDFVTFRGTNLDGFRDFGISRVEDLKDLQGQFMVEKGFTSTALARERSFADRKEGGLWIGKSNVEIHYHVPAGYRTGIGLFMDSLTYSTYQTEFLLNRNSLIYYSDVNIEQKDHATIEAIVVPREIYDNMPEPGDD